MWIIYRGFVFSLFLCLSCIFVRLAHAEVIRGSWVTDGSVNSLAVDADGTVYVGGSFTYVAPYYGTAAAFDTVSGAADGTFPKINGRVTSVISDGAGGWYVGGNFSYVNEVPRSSLVHILSDFSIDQNWDPSITNPTTVTSIRTMVLSGTTLYVGGDFTAIEGVTRNFLGAIDTVTGQPTSWNPNPSGSNVLTMELTTSTMFVGGTFSSIGGVSRTNLAEISLTTGSSTSWNGSISGGDVRDLKVVGSLLYVAGNFTSAGGSTRNRLAALSLTTGSSTTWNPNANNFINSMAFSTSTVYVGGNYTTIGGQTRNRLAELNLTSGSSTSWNPNVGATVSKILLNGTGLYIAGTITSVGGLSRPGLAEVSTVTGSSTAWDPLVRSTGGGGATGMALSGNALVLGFTPVPSPPAIGVTPRMGIFSMDSSNTLTSWNPNASGTVSSIVIASSTVYVGGSFTAIGNQTRNRIAEISKSSASATAWDPNANGTVSRILLDSSNMYVGGSFTTIGGQSRAGLAVIDTGTATATSFNPNVMGGTVSAIATSTSSVYIGGAFTAVGGTTRNRIAEIDLVSASPTAWNPNAGGTLNDLLLADGVAYVGGSFTTIGGQLRSRAAALDLSTGLATSWNPNFGSTVQRIIRKGSVVIVAGSFTTVGGQSRVALASVTTSTGALTGWTPAINGPYQISGTAFTMAPYGNTLYVGGNAGANQVNTPFLQFSTTTDSGAESASPSVMLELSETVASPISITLSTSGTATLNSDYTLPSITFPAGQLTHSFTMTLLDDSLVEGNETAVLTLLSSSPTSNQLSSTSFSYTITDNDSASINITQSGGSTQVTEGGSVDTVRVVLNSQPSADVVVSVTASSSILVTPSSLTFTTSTWNTPQDISVTAVDNAVVDGTRTGAVSFSVSSTDGAFHGLVVASVTVTVNDNDASSSGSLGGGGVGAPEVGSIPPPITVFQSTQPIVPVSGVPSLTLVKLPDDGNPLTQSDTAVYFMGTDGKRHAFTNEKAYFTWYPDFSTVQLISEAQLALIPLGTNVTYRPGVRLVKFQTNPKVYAVAKGGVLRWITSEEVATTLYGPDWNKQIDDISDAFYTDYQFGANIATSSDYNPASESAAATIPSDSLSLF